MKFRILILIGLLLMLVVPTSAFAEGSRTYTDIEWGFTLDYPKDLEVLNEGDGSVSFLDNAGTEIIRVDCYYDEATRSYDPLGGAVEGIYAILAEDYGSDWELLSEEYEDTLQGYPSGELWYTSLEGNVWWQECDYIIYAEDVVYLVSMIWPEDDMGDYWDAFYDVVYSFSVI